MVTTPLIVALDTRTAEEAVALAEQVAPHAGALKVGLRLLLGAGPATVAAIAGLGLPVFADAKLHDIPSQVEAAARRLGEYGARWVTAHVAGGAAMLEAAAAGLAAGSGGTGGVLGVTVITSLSAADLTAAGITSTPGKLTSRMAKLADAAGAEGVICSPQELVVVGDVAPRLLRVTPGIRPAGSVPDDQERTATPAEAIGKGANWLVVGRPITAAADPVAAAAALAAEIHAASGSR